MKARSLSLGLRTGGDPGGRTGDVPLPTGCSRDCGSHRAATLPPFLVVAGSCRIRALPLTLRPKRPHGRSTGRQELTAAGLGTIHPPSRGSEVGDARKCPSLGTALPCLLPQPRGLRPTAANREPVLLLTPMCQALQSANQGLIFALERGLEAFWLHKCHDHACGPAAGLSIPLMPASSCVPVHW